jgi:GNAT superfamily N-acetyltransferase
VFGLTRPRLQGQNEGLKIVPYTDVHERTARAVFAAAYPYRATEFPAHGWVVLDEDAWVDDEAIGYGTAWRVHASKFRIDVIIAPEHRRHGYGSQLLEHVVAHADGASTVQVRPLDDASVAFAAKRGFVETMRMHRMTLDLAAATHEPYRDVYDRLASAGVMIVTLADFGARNKDPDGAYLDAVVAAREGWPSPDPDPPGESSPPIDWSARIQPDPHLLVAEQRGRIVGFSGALGTGVRPDMRGQGIATALKVAAIDAAIARGESEMTTACGHPAMLHINEKLGFRETLCELRMVRRCDR